MLKNCFSTLTLLTVAAFPLNIWSQINIGKGDVAKLYQEHCAVCHGNELEGGLGGSLLGPQDYVETDQDMQQWIRDGNQELGMPAFDRELSEAEIRSLVIYIREMRQKAERKDSGSIPRKKGTFEGGGYTFNVETINNEVKAPWSIAFLPEGGMLVTEKKGALVTVRDGKRIAAVQDIPEIWAKGQGGLLEVALHPDYAENGWVYLAFSRQNGDGSGSTSIVRGRIQQNEWVDHQDVFVVPEAHHSRAGRHFGTRLVFKDGYLFFSIGDRGAKDRAQDLSSPNGKIHRIHDDGRIPEDNPFKEKPNAFASIWTYGNRNPQGLDLHPETGEIWESEHGPRGGDEINIIRKGDNYGWPVITYGMNYGGTPITEKTAAPGLEQPILYWTPSIAVCGIDFYEGGLFPEWKNNLFAGGLRSEELHRLVIEGNKIVQDEIILRDIGRVRDVASGPDGALYLVLNGPDRIVRLTPVENN